MVGSVVHESSLIHILTIERYSVRVKRGGIMACDISSQKLESVSDHLTTCARLLGKDLFSGTIKKIKQHSTLCLRCVKPGISCQTLSTKACYRKKSAAFVDNNVHCHTVPAFWHIYYNGIYIPRAKTRSMPTGLKRHCREANNTPSKAYHNLPFWHTIHQGARSVGVETIGHLFLVYISKFRPWF